MRDFAAAVERPDVLRALVLLEELRALVPEFDLLAVLFDRDAAERPPLAPAFAFCALLPPLAVFEVPPEVLDFDAVDFAPVDLEDLPAVDLDDDDFAPPLFEPVDLDAVDLDFADDVDRDDEDFEPVDLEPEERDPEDFDPEVFLVVAMYIYPPYFRN